MVDKAVSPKRRQDKTSSRRVMTNAQDRITQTSKSMTINRGVHTPETHSSSCDVMESFFLVLPSTASSHIYPNTQSHFRVQLPQPIELQGQWTVGLSEIHVPILYDNIDETTNTFELLAEETTRQETLIPIPGFSFKETNPYQSLISHVTEQIPKDIRSIIPLTPQQKQSPGYDVTFSDELTDILGLKSDETTLLVHPKGSGPHTLSHPGEGLWINIVYPPTTTVAQHRLCIPPGLYPKTQHLLQAMSDVIPKDHTQSIIFKENRDGTVSIRCKPNIKIIFPPDNHGLGTLLGFEEQKSELKRYKKGKYPADVKRGVYGLYVYSDLVQPMMVGDTFAPLLRVIPIQEVDKFTMSYIKIYTSPDFYPLMQNRFETIEMDIRTDFGQRLRFRQGKTLVKLQFKKFK